MFLLGYSSHGAAWLDSMMDLEDAEDLVPAVAHALAQQVSPAVHHGLLPGYVTVEESFLVLRGRLMEAAQLSRRHGVPLPLDIQYDEFTVDIPENQILGTALERMLRVPRVEEESARMLRRLLREFGDVTSTRSGDPVAAWVATRLIVRYHTALRLSELILRATSFEHATGTVAVNGFLLDMPKLFEDFVTVALREAIELTYGGRVLGQARYHLDVADQGAVQTLHRLARPRPSRRRGGRQVQGREALRLPNADLYQLLAYCTVLGLPVGHLIYAAGSEVPAHHVVRGSGAEITCHALNRPGSHRASSADTGPCTSNGRARIVIIKRRDVGINQTFI